MVVNRGISVRVADRVHHGFIAIRTKFSLDIVASQGAPAVWPRHPHQKTAIQRTSEFSAWIPLDAESIYHVQSQLQNSLQGLKVVLLGWGQRVAQAIGTEKAHFLCGQFVPRPIQRYCGVEI